MENEVGATAVEVIDRDVPCRACAYNLRTMSVVGNCPECGLAVRQSLVSDALWLADPPWLKGLRAGAWWSLAGLVVEMINAVDLMMQMRMRISASAGPSFWVMLLAMIARCLGPALQLAGLWLLTSSERQRAGQRGSHIKLWARAAIAVSVGGTFMTNAYLVVIVYSRGYWSLQLWILTGLAISAAWYLGHMAFWQSMRGIFRRAEALWLGRVCISLVGLNALGVLFGVILQPMFRSSFFAYSLGALPNNILYVGSVTAWILSVAALIGLLLYARPGAVPMRARS